MQITSALLPLMLAASAVFSQESPVVTRKTEGAMAPSEALPRYRVVKASPAMKATSAVNQAAEQGYRMLLISAQAIMRRDAEPPDTYRYMAVPASGLLSSFLNTLNQQGAFGYGWKAGTHWLEKEPHPHNYEYQIITGFKIKTREDSRSALLQQGFAPVGLFGNQIVFMRELGNTAAVASERSTRWLDMTSEKRTMNEINRGAREGYRLAPGDISPKGFIQMRMDPCDAACGGPFEYRKIEVKESDQLERDLNTLAREGFRVVPESFGWHPYFMERGTDHKQHFAYRVGTADEETVTEQFLNEGDRDGFVPVTFATHVGWLMHSFIVLEKPLTAE